MGAKFFIGERFEHTHENQAFDQLCQLVEAQWLDKDESVYLIGNVTCEGHELDALLVKENAITVIDFKNFGGELLFSENGPWYASGKEVKGGSKLNPYKQIHSNKFALLNWFRRVLPDIAENNTLGHISGLVLFQQPIEFDETTIPPKIKSWFNAGDFSSGYAWLVHLASTKINLTNLQQESIIAMLGVMEYQPASAITSTVLADIENLSSIEKLPSWTSSQAKAITLFKRFLKQEKPRVFLLRGMVSTGKKALLEELVQVAKSLNKSVVCLAPNATICNLQAYANMDFSSIYSHVYNTSEELEDNKIIYNPLRSKCEDDESSIYFIAEAQLLSDNYFELDNKRFGSGRTFSDFVEFINFKNNPHSKIVVIGDPYQLLVRGSLVDEEIYTNHEIDLLFHELIDIIGDLENNNKTQLAVNLVECLRSGKYNHLEINDSDNNLVVLEDNSLDRRNAYSNVFSDPFLNGQFIGFSHKRVSAVSTWGRRSLLGRSQKLPQKGDILELRNKIKLCDEVAGQDFYPGTYFNVLAESSSPIIKEIELKGRDQPIRLVFREISLRSSQNNNLKDLKLLYLEEFLLAERPELNIDNFVALNVLAELEVRKDPTFIDLTKQIEAAREANNTEKQAALKDSRRKLRRLLLAQNRFMNAAFFRYGYASTCQQARGKKWDTVVVDASYEDTGRNSEGYFRWLYTGVTRANNTVYLDKFSPITPWSRLSIKSNRVQVTSNIKSLTSFNYPKNKEIINTKMERQLPEGFTNPQMELVNLWLYCSEKLAEIGFIIQQVKQDSYREIYTIKGAQGQEHILRFVYNGSFDVTHIRSEKSDDYEALGVINHLKGKQRFNSSEANAVFDVVVAQLAKENIFVEDDKEANWQLMLNIVDVENHKAQIKIYYNKGGFLTTLEVNEVTDSQIIFKIHKAFGLTME